MFIGVCVCVCWGMGGRVGGVTVFWNFRIGGGITFSSNIDPMDETPPK